MVTLCIIVFYALLYAIRLVLIAVASCSPNVLQRYAITCFDSIRCSLMSLLFRERFCMRKDKVLVLKTSKDTVEYISGSSPCPSFMIKSEAIDCFLVSSSREVLSGIDMILQLK